MGAINQEVKDMVPTYCIQTHFSFHSHAVATMKIHSAEARDRDGACLIRLRIAK